MTIPIDTRTEKVHLLTNAPLPDTYSCQCKYCQEYKGMLIRPNGEKYNKNDRRKYYHFEQGAGGAGHINPTPLHAARWAIQRLTKPGDWVCDPFMGTGTTAVEAINHKRKAIGTELETGTLARANCEMQKWDGAEYKIYDDDARNIGNHLDKLNQENNQKLALTVYQPPYSGDEQSNAKYNRDYGDNLAFLKESQAYWDTLKGIMKATTDATKDGGYAIICVKEMMRNKAWWDLHIKLSDLMGSQMHYKGMVLLPHYPRTLHLNTYFKRWGVHPSYYQTITIFKKEF